jgi:hypothetical protein
LVVFKATNNQINNRTGIMKLLILLSAILLSIFHGVNGEWSEDIYLDTAQTNNFLFSFYNFNDEEVSAEFRISLGGLAIGRTQILIPPDATQKSILHEEIIPGKYSFERRIPSIPSSPLIFKLETPNPEDDYNWYIRYDVSMEYGDNWIPVFFSHNPDFSSGEFCIFSNTCPVTLSKLGPVEWTNQLLDIRDSDGASLVNGFQGGSSIDFTVVRDVILKIQYIINNTTNLKSAHDVPPKIGARISGARGNLSSYLGAYPSIALIDNPFIAPTGGLTSPITAEQVTEFAISIASPTYGIIENN